MELKDFLDELVKIRRVSFIKLVLIIFLLNNLLVFSVGYIVGNQFGLFTAESAYEAKLIMRDFNITKSCYENISNIIRLGQYTDMYYNISNTGTLPEQVLVCGNKTWNNTDNIAQ
jgi:hypothetical protein